MNVSIRKFATIAFLVLLSSVAAVAADGEASGVVNVNTASVEQLVLLPRVGPASAARIIQYRSENGGFEKTTDLLQVKGIGPSTFELMKPYVAVEGETTLKAKVRTSRKSSGS